MAMRGSPPFAYTYRDYVIQAFNDDKPFDGFIREQLAADQLGLADDSPTLAARTADARTIVHDRNPLLRCHRRPDRRSQARSSGAFAVMCTMPDHKIVSTADYYSLYGVFASAVAPYELPRIGPVGEAGKPLKTN
ncbi:MAG: DUF1549 domain-containing protein [Planctomycetaceae bacterium]